MQIRFLALSCSNLAALSCSSLAALSCSNLAAHCCNLAACAFFVCKLDFLLLVAACLLQTVAACLLQSKQLLAATDCEYPLAYSPYIIKNEFLLSSCL